MKKIKWLFFDLGHTLVNEDVSQRKRIENAVSYLNSVSVSVTYEQFYHEVRSTIEHINDDEVPDTKVLSYNLYQFSMETGLVSIVK